MKELYEIIIGKLPKKLTTKDFRTLLINGIRPNKKVCRKVAEELKEEGVIEINAGVIRRLV